VPADARDVAKPVLRVVADNTAGHAPADSRARAHGAGLTLLADVPRAPEPPAPLEPEDVTVGSVTLSAALWRILCDEADQHVAVLQHEVSVLQFDPDHMPVVAMVRASHTLCGIHRTGGIALIATTARALEQALLALEERGAPFPSTAQPVLARATAGLAHFVSRVKSREGFTPSDEREAADIVNELDDMRREALADMPAVDPLLPPDAFGSDVTTVPTVEAPRLVGGTPAPDAPPPVAALLRADGDIAPAEGATSAMDEGLRAEPPGDEHLQAEPQVDSSLRAEPPIESRRPAEQRQGHEVHVEEPIVDFPPLAGHLDAPRDEEWPARTPPSAPASPPAPEPAAWPLPAAPAPAAPRPVASDESLLDVTDDVDATILPIFLEEANELFPQAAEEVRAWRRAPGDVDNGAQLRRTLHTLKGSARMAGAMRLGELAHRMESRLTLGDVPVTPTADLFEALDTDLDRIGFVLDALREGKSNVALPWLAAPEATAPAVTPFAEAIAPERAVAASAGAHAEAATRATAPSRSADHPEPDAARALLRVRADIVDQLVNEAGEVAIARARVEGELRALKANLLELTNSVIRLRGQVREIELAAETQIQSRMSLATTSNDEFDPLELDRYTRFQELTRSFAEGINDVSTVQQALLKNLDDADAALIAQARLSRDVQQRLFAIRTVPFGSLSDRLYRILRKTARELDKRANLEINGGQTELDRSVLEKLVGPLEHLLRNALDHGIESRAARVAAGKSETGEVALTVRQVGNEIAISSGLDAGDMVVAQGAFFLRAERERLP